MTPTIPGPLVPTRSRPTARLTLTYHLRYVNRESCSHRRRFTADFHVAQIRRYEAGPAQPTLDFIRRLARAPTVTADLLAFDTDQRGPSQDLALVFEAASQLDDEGPALVKALW